MPDQTPYDMQMQSLIASAMQPQSAEPDSGALQTAYRQVGQRQAAQQQSARMAPGGYGTPLAQHLIAARQQPQIQQAPQQQANPLADPSSPAGVAARYGTASSFGTPAYAAHQQIQAPQPMGSAGQQANGNWNVEVLRGNPNTPGGFDRDMSSFDSQGNAVAAPGGLNDLMAGLTPEQQKQIQAYHHMNGGNAQQTWNAVHQMSQLNAAGHKQQNPQNFNQANEQDMFRYKDAERQIGQLEKRLPDLGPEAQAKVQQKIDQLHGTMDETGTRMNSWTNDPTILAQRADQRGHNATSRLHNLSQQEAETEQGYQENKNIPAGAPRPPERGAKLPPEEAAKLYQMSGGDPVKARELAKRLGWTS